MKDPVRELHLTFKRWQRSVRHTRLLASLEEAARRKGEYECVGGPLDGMVIQWFAKTEYYTVHGVYREALDYRLHYHALSPISQ